MLPLHRQNNHESEEKKISPLAAGIAGVILGIAGTAAIALSDKDTRKRATKKATDLKEDLMKWSEDTFQKMNDQGEGLKHEAQKAKQKGLDKVEEITHEMKPSEKVDK